MTIAKAKFINCDRGFIYLVTNMVSGKQYVGQTTYTIKERWRRHLSSRSDGIPNLGDDIKKFGQHNFSVFILAEIQDIAALEDLEKFYIKEYNTLYPAGYNLTEGGYGFVSDHTKIAISNSKVGLRFTDNPKPMKNKTRGIRKFKDNSRFKPVIGTHVLTGETIELVGVSTDDRFDPRLVSACCKGKRRQHRGYTWKYKNGS